MSIKLKSPFWRGIALVLLFLSGATVIVAVWAIILNAVI